jgi:hypothetical protein
MKNLVAILSCACVLFAAGAPPADAQVVIAPKIPRVGSANPATAAPLVPRPASKHCSVYLFQNLEFADFSSKSFSFRPPHDCPGPWAKVVFSADFTVTAGRQFDRTAAFYLGHANLYYGTTAEPSAAVSPSWHVERDVTDLSALFAAPQSGEADLGNFVGVSGGVDYTGIIYANAELEFYELPEGAAAPAVPDVVVPLPDAPGGAVSLGTTASVLAQSVTLPRNTERLYLDVIAQSQSNDEFWYTCVPNDLASELFSCGNTAFRETEISIDGAPAGVAPVTPWIYTGGIDPYLWRPIPGIETLDFKPYRVDLSPFAGMLADGNPHTVAVSVYGANSYFLVTGNLLAYTDHGASVVTGGLLENSLAAVPTPAVVEGIVTGASGAITGTVGVSATREYTIRGFANTSHGRVESKVQASIKFSNTQTFDITATNYIQNVDQSTSVYALSSTMDAAGATHVTESFRSFPLVVDYAQIGNADGSFNVTTTARQQSTVDETGIVSIGASGAAATPAKPGTRIVVAATDTLLFDASGAVTGHEKQATSESYFSLDSAGACYSREIAAAAGLLTSVKDGIGCPK